jgi:hypothetical protein
VNPVIAQHVIYLLLAFSLSSAVLTAWFADRKGLNVAFWGLAGLVLFVLALAVVILTPSQREPGSRPNAQAIPQRQPREHAKRRVWWLASGAPRPRVAGETEESS